MKKSLIFHLLFILIFVSCNNKTPFEEEKFIKPVRGAWLTNVDSEVLNSKENIIEAVKFYKELGLNTIFVVTWNKAMTSFPSKVAKAVTGIEIDTTWTGRDPLKELIEEAHKEGLKVIAWFEFGFSTSYNLGGGPILASKPHWAAIDTNGNLVKKNNFEWMNAFHPEVQQFMIDLIMEVVKNYDIDGIQGDDRLPALPSEAGYDEFTINLYKEQHNGKEPPRNSKDSSWVQWRANLLTKFLERLYNEVKNYNNKLIVSMSPSIYPWSKEEYLQDWPEWMNRGLVDIVSPQLYRYEFERYEIALNEILEEQLDPKYKDRFYPGILLKVGSYYPTEKFLKQMIELNRERGVNGEVYFFYEGLKKHSELIKSFYKSNN